jgi:hypothetical protein
MPDVSVSVTLRHGKYTTQPIPFTGAASITQDSTVSAKLTIVATTSWAVIPQSLPLLGVMVIRNLDDTNYVEIALADDDSSVFAKLLPLGAPLVLPAYTTFETATYYIKANTESCHCTVMQTSL